MIDEIQMKNMLGIVGIKNDWNIFKTGDINGKYINIRLKIKL